MNKFWKTKLWAKSKEKKPSDWLILILGGVLLLIIFIPTQKQSEKKLFDGKEDSSQENKQLKKELSSSEYQKELEERLEQMLSQMQGVGKVDVMVTLASSEEDILDKNVSREEEKNTSDTVVYRDSNTQMPYVTSRVYPKVEGVLIVAQGAGKGEINKEISEGIQALLSIEAHKIKIVKMSN